MSRTIYFQKCDEVLDWFNRRADTLDSIEKSETAITPAEIAQERKQLLVDRNEQLFLLGVSIPHDKVCGCQRCNPDF